MLVVAQGTFITDDCQSDADCASGCCGFNTGKCAGPVVAQERDGGCGFVAAGGDATAALASDESAGTGTDAAAPAGTLFITQECGNDAECASGCCAFNTGKCAGAVVAQERDGGCGRGDAQPNDNAAQALQGRKY